MLVMGHTLPARHQPGADRGMFRQSVHRSLCNFKRGLSLLCKSASHRWRGWPGLGLHLEHGA